MRRISVAAVTVAGLFYSQTHPYEVNIVLETQVKEKRTFNMPASAVNDLPVSD